MPVIKTQNNKVIANEPEPEDEFVMIAWHGPPQDGRHLHAFEGTPQPIKQYQALIDWAVGIADQMVHPLYVVPLRARDVFKPADVLRVLPRLNDQERGRLRAVVVRAMAQVMRDCADQQVRADAYAVLAQLRVVQS